MSVSLELKLDMFATCSVGTENRAQVLRRALNHLSIFFSTSFEKESWMCKIISALHSLLCEKEFALA